MSLIFLFYKCFILALFIQDQLKNAKEVTSGVGLKLMQKMGWTPGEGLGKDGAGPLVPLVLDIKADRKGSFNVFGSISIFNYSKLCASITSNPLLL